MIYFHLTLHSKSTKIQFLYIQILYCYFYFGTRQRKSNYETWKASLFKSGINIRFFVSPFLSVYFLHNIWVIFGILADCVFSHWLYLAYSPNWWPVSLKQATFSSLLFCLSSYLPLDIFLLISRNALCYNLNLSPVSLSLSLSWFLFLASTRKKQKQKKLWKEKRHFFETQFLFAIFGTLRDLQEIIKSDIFGFSLSLYLTLLKT